MKKLLLIICIIASGVNAQTAEEMLGRLQDKFETINDFTAEFSQTSSTTMGNNINASGKFYFKKPGMFRAEMDNAVIVQNDGTIWNYNSELNRTVISSIDDSESSFSIKKYIFEYPEHCNLELMGTIEGGQDYNILMLRPFGNELEFQSAKIWSNRNYIIRKIEVMDWTNTLYTFEFNDVRTNQNLPNELFTFTAPEGTRVIDLR